jgi:hypothetical protein
MSDIFISHLHEDEVAAKAISRFLIAKLPKEHRTVFVSTDERQILLGDDWLTQVREALRTSKIVIALLSPEAVTRPWVNFEAGAAWFSTDKILIPLCLGDLRPENFPKPYSNIQGINLHDSEAPYYLVQSSWKILRGGGSLVPPPFRSKDEDVANLKNELSWWSVGRRARATGARLELEESSDSAK